MSDFKEVVDYFKFNRRGEKANKETNYHPVIYVDENYNTAIETEITSVLKSFLSTSYCKYIGNEIAGFDFYFRKATAGHLLYYIKENVDTNPRYRRIPIHLNDQWETLPENEINQLTLIKEGNNLERYFDIQNEVVFEIQLREVIVFSDYFLYHPNDIKTNEGEHTFDFKNHEGYDNSASDWALRLVIDPWYKTVADSYQMKVELVKNNKSALLNILPKINKNMFGKYIVRYTYYEKGIKHNSIINERAVKLKFNFYGAFLEYLNQTIFYFLDNVSYFESPNRKLFLDDYLDIVYSLLKNAKGEDILKVLYYVPIGMFEKINPKFIWAVLDETLKGFVTNAGTNTEDIVLHILKGLSKTTTPDVFMKELLHSKNTKDTRFSLLFDKLNGDHFKTFVELVHKIWFESNYTKPDNELYKDLESPFVVNYEAKKEATFFYSNMNISWVNANLLKYEPDTSWWDEIVTVLNPALGEVVKQFTETEKSFYYHPFQPIAINNFDKQQTGIALTSPLFPAFVLKAGEDVAFWENVTTATEYVIDIVTTFSGVGNIAKFRHLYTVSSKASKLRFIGRAAKAVKTAARGAVGVIEISSGTVNALLKITDLRDEEWAKELSEFLLILELCSLGADLGEFLLKRARSSAKNALEYEDEIRKQLDEVTIEDGSTTRKLTETEKGKFFDELYEVAELDYLAKWDDLPVSGKG